MPQRARWQERVNSIRRSPFFLYSSEPASPPFRAATSPRKASRLENFCTKIRHKAATLHSKGKQAEVKKEPSVPVMSTAQMEPARTGRRPQNLHISKAQLPSPPLTSGMPSQGPPGQRPVGDAWPFPPSTFHSSLTFNITHHVKQSRPKKSLCKS
jgi:hypothetical protein